MEMCYDGALVMPSSYAVMDEEEMTYVEGGGSVSLYSSGNVFNIYKIHYTAKDCAKIALVCGVIAGVATIVATLTGPIGALAGGITAGTCTIVASCWSYAASVGGLNVYVPLLKTGKFYKKKKTTFKFC